MYRRHRGRIGDTDNVGTDPDKSSILLVEFLEYERKMPSLVDTESPKVSEGCEKGSRDGRELAVSEV